jgi:hypothetical protein
MLKILGTPAVPKNVLPTSQKHDTRQLKVRKTLMLFTEIIRIYCADYSKQANNLYGKMNSFLMLR